MGLEGAAGNEFGDDENVATVLAVVIDLDDARMGETCNGAGFVPETLDECRASGPVGGKNLDSYVAAQLWVACAVHAARTAAADGLKHPVAAQCDSEQVVPVIGRHGGAEVNGLRETSLWTMAPLPSRCITNCSALGASHR